MSARSSSRASATASASSSFRFEEMTRTERVMAAVRGEPVDRLPICFWHHFEPERHRAARWPRPPSASSTRPSTSTS